MQIISKMLPVESIVWLGVGGRVVGVGVCGRKSGSGRGFSRQRNFSMLSNALITTHSLTLSHSHTLHQLSFSLSINHTRTQARTHNAQTPSKRVGNASKRMRTCAHTRMCACIEKRFPCVACFLLTGCSTHRWQTHVAPGGCIKVAQLATELPPQGGLIRGVSSCLIFRAH